MPERQPLFPWVEFQWSKMRWCLECAIGHKPLFLMPWYVWNVCILYIVVLLFTTTTTTTTAAIVLQWNGQTSLASHCLIIILYDKKKWRFIYWLPFRSWSSLLVWGEENFLTVLFLARNLSARITIDRGLKEKHLRSLSSLYPYRPLQVELIAFNPKHNSPLTGPFHIKNRIRFFWQVIPVTRRTIVSADQRPAAATVWVEALLLAADPVLFPVACFWLDDGIHPETTNVVEASNCS